MKKKLAALLLLLFNIRFNSALVHRTLFYSRRSNDLVVMHECIDHICELLHQAKIGDNYTNSIIEQKVYNTITRFNPDFRYSVLLSMAGERTLQAMGRMYLASEVLARMKEGIDWMEEKPGNLRTGVPLPDGAPVIVALKNLDDTDASEGLVEKELAKFLVNMELYKRVAPANEFELIYDLEYHRLRSFW